MSYYYVYPDVTDFPLGDITAIVRVVGLRHNVLVPESPDAMAWVYTPLEIEIVDPLDSGLPAGGLLTVALPGGSVKDFTSPYIWVFDKAEIDPQSLYVLSWTEYDYPEFDLGLQAQFLYEVAAGGEALALLQFPIETHAHRALDSKENAISTEDAIVVLSEREHTEAGLVQALESLRE